MSTLKKGVVTVNSALNDFLNGANNSYAGSQRLLTHFESSGMDVLVAHPEDINVDVNNNLYFSRLFKYQPYSTNLVEVDPSLGANDLDFLWIRQIGENKQDVQFTKKFCEMIDSSTISSKYVLNPQGSTKYFLKDVQKAELEDIPFPKQYSINSVSDIEGLLNQNEKLIAKPHSGWKGQGIKNILSTSDLDSFLNCNVDFKDYTFEEYISLPKDGLHELRISFIGDDMWARGKIYSVDSKGYDTLDTFVFPSNISEYHKAIVNTVKDQTGMHMGSVDFRPRGDKGGSDAVIEVNNAGIGLSFEVAPTFYSQFNLEPFVLRYIRNKIQ